MGTESHGGDGGPLEDREDGEDDTVTTALLLDPERRAASVPAAGGGRAAHCADESSQVHERRSRWCRRRTRLSNVPTETP